MKLIAEIAAALASDRVLLETLDDGSGVILNLEGSQVLSLNDSGMCVVESIRRGLATAEELVEALMDEFEVDADTARRDIDSLIVGLHHELAKV
jgi:hypothetical protein